MTQSHSLKIIGSEGESLDPTSIKGKTCTCEHVHTDPHTGTGTGTQLLTTYSSGSKCSLSVAMNHYALLKLTQAMLIKLEFQIQIDGYQTCIAPHDMGTHMFSCFWDSTWGTCELDSIETSDFLSFEYILTHKLCAFHQHPPELK